MLENSARSWDGVAMEFSTTSLGFPGQLLDCLPSGAPLAVPIYTWLCAFVPRSLVFDSVVGGDKRPEESHTCFSFESVFSNFFDKISGVFCVFFFFSFPSRTVLSNSLVGEGGRL